MIFACGPRLPKEMARFTWTSWHAWTQRPQRMHLPKSLMMKGFTSSVGYGWGVASNLGWSMP